MSSKRIQNTAEITLKNAVETFLTFSKSKNLSSTTLSYYHYSLLPFTRFIESHYPNLPFEQISSSIIREAITWQKEASSSSTANHCLALIKRLYNFLISEEYTEHNPSLKVEKLRTPKRLIETFSQEQIQQILDTCKGREFLDTRDRAIILLLLDTGMRASELCGINFTDVNLEKQSINIIGKGDKERIVPFGEGVLRALQAYLKIRAKVDRHIEAVFITRDYNPIDKDRLGDLVERRCSRAGIKGVRCSPHTFRHTAAVSYLRAGGDTFTLQMMLGHTSQEMTKRYCASLSDADVHIKHRKFSPVDNLGLQTEKRTRIK